MQMGEPAFLVGAHAAVGDTVGMAEVVWAVSPIVTVPIFCPQFRQPFNFSGNPTSAPFADGPMQIRVTVAR